MLLFAVAFGLSTDYGVFLLGRIKELHDSGLLQRGGGRARAAAHGPDRHVRRALMVIAIGCFVTSSIVFIKQLGFGTAVAVLIDATIVRALLVPALMRLLGDWNWWAPRPLARLHRRWPRRMNEIGYLGLGSNVGDRRANLQAAIELLWAHDVDLLPSSSVYETEPVGEVLDQRAFFNACLRVETELDPGAAAGRLQGGRAGARPRAGGRGGYVRHGPRPIDVDLLLLGDRRLSSERLTLPHREVTSRRFVLVPLLELAPDLVVPGAGRAADALARLDGQDVRRAGPPLDVGP